MIYLDNSATTKQYRQVTELMTEHMDTVFGNPSSLYQLGVDSEKSVRHARRQLEQALAMGDGRAYFTSGGTEADNMAVFGAAKALKRRGRRVITSAVEHPAVLECFKALEADGFDVVYIGVDKKCRLDMEQLEAAVNSDTILVSVMHVNNETGTIMPIQEISSILKKNAPEALLHCDAVQSFGKLPMPVCADLLSVSGHKIHGPKGSGAIFIRKGVNLPPLILGGGQEEGRRSGTQNVPAIAGLGLAAEMAAEDRSGRMAELAEIRNSLMEGLKTALDDIVINSPEQIGEAAGECCSTLLNVSFMGTRGEVLLHTLEQDGIYVSTGSACSSNKKGRSHVLSAMGLSDKAIEGTLRFSLGRFNTMDEVGYTIDKVTAAVKRFRKLGSFR